jgi:hypothetical protein
MKGPFILSKWMSGKLDYRMYAMTLENENTLFKTPIFHDGAYRLNRLTEYDLRIYVAHLS